MVSIIITLSPYSLIALFTLNPARPQSENGARRIPEDFPGQGCVLGAQLNCNPVNYMHNNEL